MRILAFDLGRTTGWAVLEDGKLSTGSYRAQGDDEASVFVDWSSFATLRISGEHPEAIAFEDVTFNRGRSYIPGMKALLYVKAHQQGLTCFGVDVQTLKKFAREQGGVTGNFSGKWTGSKDNMHEALLRVALNRGWDVAGVDDNEVDAAWIAIWLDETAIETPVVP